MNQTTKDFKMTQEVNLVILIEVQLGKSEEQINLYNKIKPLVLAERGCLQYELSKVSGSAVKFVLLERWESEEALAAHDVTPHMIEADAISPSFRSGPVSVLELNNV